jgi:Transglycosylase SLT domain
MAENILESYFIKVGALPDMSSFTTLGKQLVKTGASIGKFSEETVKEIYKLDAAAIAVFGAMGIGLIKLADKTAMMDQQYRLLGLRMLMNKDAARAMQMSLDALGATIDEVAYDPELNKRFNILYDRFIKTGKLMGITFDEITMKMRDVRMEYKMFVGEFEMLAWGTIAKTFDKLGFGQDAFQEKLKGINNWLMEHIPEWSDKVSNDLVPVWKDMENVIGDVKTNLELAAEGFIHLTGELTGNTSLIDAQLNFDTLAKATQEWVDLLDKAILDISFITRWLLHDYRGVTGLISGSVEALIPGRHEEAEKKLTNAFENIEEAAKDASWVFFNLGDPKDAQNIDKYRKMLEERKTWQERTQTVVPSPEQLKNLFGALGEQFANVPPELIASVVKGESHGDVFSKSPTGPEGVMQLSKATQQRFGVTNPWDVLENIPGGTAYLSNLLKRYQGNLPKAVLGYHEGEGGLEDWAKMDQILKQLASQGDMPGQDIDLDRALGAAAGLKVRGTFKRAGKTIDAFLEYENRLKELYGEKEEGMPFPDIPASREAQKYARGVLKDYQSVKAQMEAGGDFSVIIHTLNIHVPKDLPKEQWGEFVQNKLFEAQQMKTRQTQAQVAAGAHK